MDCPFLLRKEAPNHWARGEQPRLGRGGEGRRVCVCVCVYLKKNLGCSCLKPQGHKLTIPKTKECLLLPSSLPQRPWVGTGLLAYCGLISLPSCPDVIHLSCHQPSLIHLLFLLQEAQTYQMIRVFRLGPEFSGTPPWFRQPDL